MKAILKTAAIILSILTLGSALASCGSLSSSNRNEETLSGYVDAEQFVGLNPSTLLEKLNSNNYTMDVTTNRTGTENSSNSTIQLVKFDQYVRSVSYVDGMREEGYFDFSNNRMIFLDNGQWKHMESYTYNHSSMLEEIFGMSTSTFFSSSNYTFDEASSTYRMKQDAINNYLNGASNAVAFISITDKGSEYEIKITSNSEGEIFELVANISFTYQSFDLPWSVLHDQNNNDNIYEEEEGDDGYVEDNYYDMFVGEEEFIEGFNVYVQLMKDGNYCVTNCEYSEEVTIPAQFNGTKITRIGRYAFSNIDQETVSIPLSVTTIDDHAFSGAYLDYIDIPNSVTTLGKSVFQYSCVRYVTLSESITAIPDYTFDKCYQLKSISLPHTIVSIGERAFYECTALDKLTIPEGVTEIGKNALASCDFNELVYTGDAVLVLNDIWYTDDMKAIVYVPQHVTEVTVPASVTDVSYSFANLTNLKKVSFAKTSKILEIGHYAFFDCRKLESVSIPDSVKVINENAFAYCSALTSLTLPSSLEKICNSAFSYCMLESIELPESLTHIDAYAFANSNIDSIHIPANVLDVASTAFYRCSSLKRITVSSYNERYIAIEDCLVDADSSILVFSTTASIPADNRITTIGDHALANGEDLVNIYIPRNITHIGGNAFSGVFNASIYIPSSVGFIASYAFCEYTQFIFCEADSKPSTWEDNWNYAEVPVTWGFSKNKIPTGELEFNLVEGSYGDYYIVSGIGSVTNKTVIIPQTYNGLPVTAIEYNSFSNLGIETIVIPEGITSIGSYAFSGTKISSLHLPSTLITIQSSAIWSCDNLTSITVAAGNEEYHASGNCLIDTRSQILVAGIANSVIPTDGSVKIIGTQAFYSNNRIEEFTIPDSINQIFSSAFGYCKNLKVVNIGSGLRLVNGEAFENCESLASFNVSLNNPYLRGEGANLINKQENKLIRGDDINNIPDGITDIGYGAFSNRNFTEITIPEGITFIDTYAFSDCYYLNKVHLPSTLERINEGAFDGCELEEITMATGNRYYFVSGNCLIEKATGTLVQGTSNSVIPQDGSVKIIGDNAFSGIGIVSVVIPDSVLEIGYWAFSYCYELEYIYIPSSVVTMGSSVFYNVEDFDINCESKKLPSTWNAGWLDGAYEYSIYWNVK